MKESKNAQVVGERPVHVHGEHVSVCIYNTLWDFIHQCSCLCTCLVSSAAFSLRSHLFRATMSRPASSIPASLCLDVHTLAGLHILSSPAACFLKLLLKSDQSKFCAACGHAESLSCYFNFPLFFVSAQLFPLSS